MILEGVVSNVANFGAFVDVGIHQDGLVHISALTNKFISDPREVVKAGDIVKVKVLEVDVPRKRISFTMRLDDTPSQNNNAGGKPAAGKPQSKGAGRANAKANLVQIRVAAIATASLKTAPWATRLLMHLLKQKSKQ